MPPNHKMLVGKEEIRPLVQGILKDAKEIELTEITTPSEIKVFGNWAFDLGITTFKARGKPSEDTNKYIRIWQKMADGSWKLARVIFNSNNPLPPEEE
jgi:ketosteroid isomerase-like protein